MANLHPKWSASEILPPVGLPAGLGQAKAWWGML